MDGKKPWRAAEIEAMEEAGVEGKMSKSAIGTYAYKKKLANGSKVNCEVRLFPMKVKNVLKRWPERHERKRRWFTPKGAAKAVKEPELISILESLVRSKDEAFGDQLLRAS